MAPRTFFRDLLAPLQSTGFLVGMLVVLLFKGWMIWQLPSPLFHPDSHTFLRTSAFFWEDGQISVHPKRAWLYPVIMALLTPLPGGLNMYMLLLQHLLAMLIPLSLVASLKLVGLRWKLWAFPCAILLGLNAPMLFYSHDIMAELPYAAAFWLFLFALVRLSVRGCQESSEPLASVFWTAALALSFRPDGKLTVLFACLALAVHWRGFLHYLPQRRGLLLLALPMLACLGLWLGTRVTQQGWLFYSSVFPLTRLETPLRAEYKTEIAEALRETLSSPLDAYPPRQKDIMARISQTSDPAFGPKWALLKAKGGQNRELHRICKELAIEAALGNPWGVVRLTYYKIRMVMQDQRDLAKKFAGDRLVEDYDRQFAEHPIYAQYLFGSEQAWLQARTKLLELPEPTLLTRVFAYIEKITSPVWWSGFGLLSAIGWLLAAWRCRPLLWIPLVSAASIVITLTIARGIIRYLVPAEPLLWSGIIMLVAVWWMEPKEKAKT
jgi:hypothetical protein